MTEYTSNINDVTEEDLEEFIARALAKSKQYQKETKIEKEKMTKAKVELIQLSGKSEECIMELMSEFKTQILSQSASEIVKGDA